MIIETNHMSFTVSNLDRSIRFYEGLLGLQTVSVAGRDPAFSARVTGIPGAVLRIAYLRVANCAVELIQYLSPEGVKIDTRSCNVGSSHICFVVDDFDDLVERLRQAQVVFAGEPSIVPAGPNKGRAVLYFEDPDSNTVEILSDAHLTAPSD